MVVPGKLNPIFVWVARCRLTVSEETFVDDTVSAESKKSFIDVKAKAFVGTLLVRSHREGARRLPGATLAQRTETETRTVFQPVTQACTLRRAEA